MESNRGRVLRGGSWNNNANNCRVANRNNNTSDNRNNNNGFRLALHFQVVSSGTTPGIARFKDHASVAMEVLASFLRRASPTFGPTAESAWWSRVGPVGREPTASSGSSCRANATPWRRRGF
ncbi:MAG: SUMF1/EgtB/PvdO family nonheme iron enzyme [Planctomycetota bacterium]